MFNHTISVNTKNGVVNYTLSLTYKRMKTIVFDRVKRKKIHLMFRFPMAHESQN